MVVDRWRPRVCRASSNDRRPRRVWAPKWNRLQTRDRPVRTVWAAKMRQAIPHKKNDDRPRDSRSPLSLYRGCDPRSARARSAELLQEPGLLRFAEHRLRWLVFAEIAQWLTAQRNQRRWPPLVVGRTGVENIESFFRQHLRKILGKKAFHLRPVGKVLGPVGAIVGQDQIDIAPETQSTVRREAADRRQIVRLQS